jgi:hypothetical protein
MRAVWVMVGVVWGDVCVREELGGELRAPLWIE